MKQLKTIAGLVIFLLGLGGLHAQETLNDADVTDKSSTVKSHSLELVSQVGGPGSEKAYASAIDSDRSNFYTVGAFSQTLTVNTTVLDEFEEDTLIIPITLIAKGEKDGLVSKYNRSGHLLWVMQLSATTFLNATVIDVDKAGAVYVAGTFKGDFNYSEIGQDKTLTSTGEEGDAFVLYLNQNGEIEWVRKFGGAESILRFTDLELGSSNSIFLSGDFRGKTNFNTHERRAESHPEFLSSEESYNGFMLKLEYLGDFRWVKQISCGADSHTSSMEIDKENNIYLSGNFELGTTFSENHELSAVGSTDGYVAKYTEDGEVLWVEGFGSINSESITSMALNSDDKLLVCGNFKTDFYEEEAAEECVFLEMKTNGSSDGFILSLDSDGKLEWNKHVKTESDIFMQGIATYENNDVLVVGYTKEQFKQSMYTLKLMNSGTVLSEKTFDGDGTFGSVQPNSLIIDNGEYNDAFIFGEFKETLRINSIEYPSKGSSDMFVVKLK